MEAKRGPIWRLVVTLSLTLMMVFGQYLGYAGAWLATTAQAEEVNAEQVSTADTSEDGTADGTDEDAEGSEDAEGGAAVSAGDEKTISFTQKNLVSDDASVSNAGALASEPRLVDGMWDSDENTSANLKKVSSNPDVSDGYATYDMSGTTYMIADSNGNDTGKTFTIGDDRYWDVTGIWTQDITAYAGEPVTFGPIMEGWPEDAQYDFYWVDESDSSNWGSLASTLGQGSDGIANYGTSPSYTFTPTKAGTYDLYVFCRNGRVQDDDTANRVKWGPYKLTVNAARTLPWNATASWVASDGSTDNNVTLGTSITFGPKFTGTVPDGLTYNYFWQYMPDYEDGQSGNGQWVDGKDPIDAGTGTWSSAYYQNGNAWPTYQSYTKALDRVGQWVLVIDVRSADGSTVQNFMQLYTVHGGDSKSPHKVWTSATVDLDPGTYWVHEIKAGTGYILDTTGGGVTGSWGVGQTNQKDYAVKYNWGYNTRGWYSVEVKSTSALPSGGNITITNTEHTGYTHFTKLETDHGLSYCANRRTSDTPPTGTVYTVETLEEAGISKTYARALYYVLANGYGSTNTEVNLGGFTGNGAIAVTQAAVWTLLEPSTDPSIITGSKSGSFYAAAKALIDAGMAYANSSDTTYDGCAMYGVNADGHQLQILYAKRIPATTATLRVTDVPGTSTVSVKKLVADTGAALPGAEFTVRYYDNYDGTTSGAPKHTWVIKTDDTGTATLKDRVSGDALIMNGDEPVVPLGTVSIQETKAPEGYGLETLAEAKANDTASTIVAGADGEAPYHVQVLTLQNSSTVVGWKAPTVKDQKSRQFQLQKTGTAGSTKGAQYDLKAANGTTYTLTVQDDNGNTNVLTGLANGTYTLKEKTVPTSGAYKADGRTYTVTIQDGTTAMQTLDFTDGKTTSGTASLTANGKVIVKLIDQPKTYSYRLRKSGPAGEPVAGVTYRLTGGPDNISKDLTTGTDGYTPFATGLRAGTYKLTETKSTGSYVKDGKTYTVTIGNGTSGGVTLDFTGGKTTSGTANLADGKAVTVLVKDAATWTFQIQKTGSAGSRVGATYVLTYPDKKTTKTLTVADAAGNTNVVSGLAEGTYTIKETKAPTSGAYQADGTTYTVTIKAGTTNATQMLDFTDGKTTSGTATLKAGGKAIVKLTDPESTMSIKLRKASAFPDLTNGNKCYSLAGANYLVSTKADMSAPIGQMITDAKGDAAMVGLTLKTGTTPAFDAKNVNAAYRDASLWNAASALKAGTYYIQERAAATNYQLDKTVYKVTVKIGTTGKTNAEVNGSAGGTTTTLVANGTLTVKVKDVPGNDPIGLILTKTTSDAKHTPIEGAQFTVRYYDNMTGDISGTPKYTWVLKSDAKGLVSLDEDHLDSSVTSSKFIKDAQGRIILPYGTLTIQETKAPTGFLLETIGQAKANSVNPWTITESAGAAPIHKIILGAEDAGFAKFSNIKVNDHDDTLIKGSILLDDASGTHAMSVGKTTSATDTVTYVNATPGATYKAVGTLHVRSADKKDGGVAKDASGKEITATTTFTPGDRGEHAFDLKYEGIDTTAFAGKVLVSYVTITKQGTAGPGETMSFWHNEIGDEDETVWVPSIHTTIAWTSSSMGNVEDALKGALVASVGTHGLTDTVSYEGLKPGQEYTLTGTLHVRAANGTDEGALKDALGKDITARATFTPTATAGTQDVTFTDIDASSLVGKSLVAFETLSVKGTDGTDKTVASHDDITDEGQTLVVPGIRTKLVAAVAGPDGTNKSVQWGKDQELIDTVAYENLVPGQKYTVVGTLRHEALGLDSGAVSATDGTDATASVTFTPTAASGTVDVTFKHVDTTNGLGVSGDIVAYESLYVGDKADAAKELAEHKDINDADQTVGVTGVVEMPLTGQGGAWWPIALGIAAAAGCLVIARRRYLRG